MQQLISPGAATSDAARSPAPRSCLDIATYETMLAIDPGRETALPCAVEGQGRPAALSEFMLWHQIALDSTAIDHTPPAPGDLSRTALEHPGPHRSSRAMAIVHAAMFDALNAFDAAGEAGRYRSFAYMPAARTAVPESSDWRIVRKAVATAAYLSLCKLYDAQKARLGRLYVLAGHSGQDQTASPPTCAFEGAGAPTPADGGAIGIAAASEIWRKRMTDNAQHQEPDYGKGDFPASIEAGKWRPDPISGLTFALGGHWSRVPSFSGLDPDNFLPPPPPQLSDPAYLRDFDEVKRIGGLYSVDRKSNETFIGRFWAYDGTAFLCAPPRLYNQIVRTLVLDPRIPAKNDTRQLDAAQKPLGVFEKANLRSPLNVARVFALANLGMADAAISAWTAKYKYNFWRPVTAIRSAGADANPLTAGDLTWEPVGAPASNSAQQPNFTPPFPAYPSGHATFGGALFQILRNFFDDNTAFQFVSDEYNGNNREFGDAAPRPLLRMSFPTLRAAEYENARSRVYLGVHFQFDADAGIAQGREVANYVFRNTLKCLTADRKLDEECDLANGFSKAAPPQGTAANAAAAAATTGAAAALRGIGGPASANAFSANRSVQTLTRGGQFIAPAR